MKTIFVEITPDHKIKGENLFMMAFRGLKPGRYRADVFSTNKRSLSQNAYEHVCFTLAQKGLYNAGYEEIKTMEQAKAWYKEQYLTIERPNVKTGELYKVVRRTRDLSKDETTEFIDMVRRDSLEYTGVYIPTPEEWRENLSKYDLVALG